ncbi:MAG: class I SAM-dependent methyltransferase [Candidatus Nanoarchaeia archaeon]
MTKRVEKEIENWWDESSKYYQEDSKIHTMSAHYGPFSPNENKLKLLGNVKGKKILEIGCGGGQCSIAFAKQGAKCIGIDISKEQLKYAEDLARKNKVKVNFIHGSYQDLGKIKSNSQDIVFSAFALQYSPDLKKVFKQIHRILKKRGIFLFSLDHPFYAIMDEKTQKIKRSYYKTGKSIELEIWPDKTKHKFIIYFRKVSDFYNSLVESKFFVEKIIEPFKLGGAWNNYYDKNLKLCKLIGPTIIFKTRKI